MAGNPIGNGDGSIDVSENLHGRDRATDHTTRLRRESYVARIAATKWWRNDTAIGPGSEFPADESTLLGPAQKPVLDKCLENHVAHLAVETPQALDLVSRQQQPGDFEELAT